MEARTRNPETPDGRVIEPHSISAGLDYPGIGPMHAHLFTEVKKGAASMVRLTEEALESAIQTIARLGVLFHT